MDEAQNRIIQHLLVPISLICPLPRKPEEPEYEGMVKLYASTLRGYSTEILAQAAEKVIRGWKSRSFPQPAHLIGFCIEAQKELAPVADYGRPALEKPEEFEISEEDRSVIGLGMRIVAHREMVMTMHDKGVDGAGCRAYCQRKLEQSDWNYEAAWRLIQDDFEARQS